MAVPPSSVAVYVHGLAPLLAQVDGPGAASSEWFVFAALIAATMVFVLVAMQARHRRRFEASNAALRESQQLLASITDNIAEAIYRTEPNGRLVFVNRAYLRLFGYGSIEELNALPRERLYSRTEDRLHLLRQLEEKATFANEELEFVRKDGSRFWGLISSTATRDASGRPVFFDGIISDVTERKLAETKILDLNQSLERRITERTAELSTSEARLRTLVDHAPEAIVVFDDDTGRFVQCNENALRLYGISEQQLFRLGFADVSPDQQPDGHRSIELARQRIREALSGEAPVFEWVQRHSTGRLFSCEVRLVRLPAEGRHLIRGSIIDNTERHRRERIQQATYQISEAVNAAQDLESLYPRIHAIIRGLMEADNFYIALYDERTERVSFPYWVDEKDLRPAPAPLNAGLTSWVIRNGKPLLFRRAASPHRRSADGPVDEPYVEAGTPAAVRIGAPMRTGGRILGAIAVQHYEDDSVYGDDDKQMLTFVAEQTAWAIERKRAERALRESEEKHRVIEDEPEMRRNLLTILRLEKFDPLGAENGKAGIALAKSAKPDLILCDVMMPEIDGFGVLQALRADAATTSIPFIFLTAKGEKVDIRGGMNLGADDYLTKPVDKSDLLAAITSRFKRQQQQVRNEFRPNFDSFEPLCVLGLTPRVAEVLLWVAQGKTNSDIASILGVSESTVKKHVQEIFEKLGVETRSAAALRAMEILGSRG